MTSKAAEPYKAGVKAKIGYGFAGRVFFDLDEGSIDESRVRMDMDVTAEGQRFVIGGMFIIEPT